MTSFEMVMVSYVYKEELNVVLQNWLYFPDMHACAPFSSQRGC